jgi:hypothetical protein
MGNEVEGNETALEKHAADSAAIAKEMELVHLG